MRQMTEGVWVSALAADQMDIGRLLTQRDRMLITRIPLTGKAQKILATPIFGYAISFTGDAGETGWFSPEARTGNLRRCWDISMPETLDQSLWKGCARRAINGYIPRFEEENAWDSDKYTRLGNETDFDPHPGEPKTLNHLACEDRRLDEQQRWVGVDALMTLKGDVDNLGTIFQQGLRSRPLPGWRRSLGSSMPFSPFIYRRCARAKHGFAIPTRCLPAAMTSS